MNKMLNMKLFMVKHDIAMKSLSWASGLNQGKLSDIRNGRVTATALQLRQIQRGFAALGYFECDLPLCLKPTLTAIANEA